jgi:hypothetical protein
MAGLSRSPASAAPTATADRENIIVAQNADRLKKHVRPKEAKMSSKQAKMSSKRVKIFKTRTPNRNILAAAD